jgi:hypothetical protein
LTRPLKIDSVRTTYDTSTVCVANEDKVERLVQGQASQLPSSYNLYTFTVPTKETLRVYRNEMQRRQLSLEKKISKPTPTFDSKAWFENMRKKMQENQEKRDRPAVEKLNQKWIATMEKS